MLDLPLADLKQQQSLSLRDILASKPRQSKDTIILLSFFEPNCPWCYRQMKVFNKLESSCPQRVQPVLVGINGDARALRKELRKAKVKFPALKASKELMNIFSVPATPWTVMINTDGQPITTVRGYIPLEDLSEVFKCGYKFS